MVGVSALLAEAEAAGLAVRADGDKLAVKGPRRHEALAKELLARKPEVVAYLSGRLGGETFNGRARVNDHHKPPNKIAPRPLTEIYPVPPGDEWLADPFFLMRRRARARQET